MVFTELIENITLLLSIVILFSFILEKLYYKKSYFSILFGLIIGFASIVGMLNPFYFTEGVLFDGRSVIISVSAIFGGWLTAIISSFIAIIYRLYIGGIGAWTGVGTIITSALLGILFYYLRKKNKNIQKDINLYLFGFILNIVTLFWMFTLPSDINEVILNKVALPILVIFPIATYLFAKMLLNQEEKIEANILLKLNQKRLDLALNASNDGVWEYDVKTNTSFYSPRWKRMLGCSENEIGNTQDEWLSRVHPEDLKNCLEIVSKYFKNPIGAYEVTVRMRHKNGSYIWILSRGSAIYDDSGKVERFIGTHIDITELKEKEEALRKSEEKFKSIFLLSPDAIAIMDLKSKKIIDINQEFINFFGYEKREIIDKDINLYNFFIDNEKKSIFQEKIKKYKKVINFESEFYSKDKSKYIGLISAKTFLLSDIEYILIIIKDITYEKKVQQELLQKSEIMITQSKEAVMGQMISMIAHQWKQPLSIISMSVNNLFLSSSMNELNKEFLEDKLNDITLQIEYLAKTIDNFRNFFIPNKDKLSLLPKEVIDKTLQLIEKSLENRQIKLNIKHNCFSKFEVIENELIQVLINIIKNAKDILYSREIINPQINISDYEDEKFIYIEVEDNGGGVEKEIFSEIFKPYFSTKDKSEGMGLGLYMSKVIMKEHLNGELIAENGNKGAKFILKFKKGGKK